MALTETLPTIAWPSDGTIPNNDLAAVEGLLNSPGLVLAYLDKFLAKNVLTFQLFQGRIEAQSGAAAVQQGVPQLATPEGGDTLFNRGVETPGSAFPLATTGEAEPVLFYTSRVSAKSVIFRQKVVAMRRSAVDLSLGQLVNKYSDSCDGNSVNTISAAIPATGGSARLVTAGVTAVAATADQTGEILAPFTQAKAAISNARQGLEADTFVCSESKAAELSANGNISTLLALSQDRNSTVYKGFIGQLAGLDILTVPDVLCTGPLATLGLVLDRKRLGGLAEQIPYRANSIYHDGDWSDGTAESWVTTVAHDFVNYVQFVNAGVWVGGLFS